jgi:zinc transporter ZupT
MVLGLLLALVISLADFFTEGIFAKDNPYKVKFISFAAGVSVAYIFLSMLPEIYNGSIVISKLIFLSVLFGFAVFHLLEKHIRQYYSRGQFRKEHQIIHSASSFVYFFVVGFVLVKITGSSNISGILLFIPILFHVVIDSLPRRVTKKHHYRAMFASSAFLGAIAATFVELGSAFNLILLGIVGGALLYTVIRESLPKEREGKPVYFAVGLLLFTVLIMILWNIGL